MEIIIAVIGTVAAVIGVIIAFILGWPGFRLAWRQWRADRKQPKDVEIKTNRLKVLAVIPAPVLGAEGNNPPAVRLDIWKEWQNLEAAIREPNPSTGREKPIELRRLLPPTRDRLRRALENCDVVHLSGHGTESGLSTPGPSYPPLPLQGGEGSLLMETEHGREDLITSNAFTDLFADSKAKLVVLSACKSVNTAKALRKAGVPAVIATQESVPDNVGKLFASRFYAELTDGKIFATALEIAQSAIEREYSSEAAQNFTLLGKKKSHLKMPKNPAEEPEIHLGEPKTLGLTRNVCMVNRGAESIGVFQPQSGFV